MAPSPWRFGNRTCLLLIVVAFAVFNMLNNFSYIQSGVKRTVQGVTILPSGEPVVPVYEEGKIGCQSPVISFLEKPKPFVALASFPGSGNTWTRELLEGLTGIYTGSVYTDAMANSIGSKRCPLRGEVFIIKTHRQSTRVTHPYCDKNNKTDKHFEKSIVILRNPYDALIAEFNREKSGGKKGVANLSEFTSNNWTNFVKTRIISWGNMFRYWTKTFENPCQILVYEQLQNDTFNELINIARFLQVEVTNTTVHCVLATYKPTYKRTGKPNWLNKETLFDPPLRQIVNSEISRVLNDVTYSKQLRHSIENYLLN